MKVYDRNLTSAGTAESGRAGETQKADRFHASDRAGSSASVGDDRVEFSSSLGRLAGAMANFGASRAAKVQALAQQFQTGSYRPDSAAIGRAIIGEELSAGAQ